MRFVVRLLILFLIIAAFHVVAVFADFNQIRALLERGDFAAALRQSEQDLKINPRDYQIWTLKGVALQGLNRSADSLHALRQALKLKPDFLPALQAAAQLEYNARDPRLKQTLETILKLRPETETARAMLGVLAFEAKNCREATAHFEQAGANATAQPLVKWQLGTCYFELEQWTEAANQFRALLDIRENALIRYNLGLVQMRANQPAAAVATLKPLFAAPEQSNEKPDADALSLLAAAYEADRQIPAAIAVLRRAVEIYPNEERLYADLAAICLDHNSFALGTEILEIALKNIPTSARLYSLLGVMHASAGFADKAQTAFQKAETLAPAAAHARVGLALSLMQSGAAEQAVRVLRDAAARTPDDALVAFTLAEALLQDNAAPELLGEAKTLLRRVIEKQPENARALSMLGKIYFREQDSNNAVPILERAVRLDPRDRAAMYQLITLYNRAGRKTEAHALGKKVEKIVDAERAGENKFERYTLNRLPDAPNKQP